MTPPISVAYTLVFSWGPSNLGLQQLVGLRSLPAPQSIFLVSVSTATTQEACVPRPGSKFSQSPLPLPTAHQPRALWISTSSPTAWYRYASTMPKTNHTDTACAIRSVPAHPQGQASHHHLGPWRMKTDPWPGRGRGADSLWQVW